MTYIASVFRLVQPFAPHIDIDMTSVARVEVLAPTSYMNTEDRKIEHFRVWKTLWDASQLV